METKLFNYHLPKNLIAQTPIKNRDMSRLLVLDRTSGEIKHEIFNDILSYLNAGDALVLNETKVLPARLFGIREETNAKMEFLLLKNIDGDVWEVITKPAKRALVGREFVFGSGLMKAIILKEFDEGIRHIKLEYKGIFEEVLDEIGIMPLPPYIHEKLNDKTRYQTVYAKKSGSAAAPTAGLHFTEELLSRIKDKGIRIVKVTLHVGLGTFRPVKVDNILNHKMHSEHYYMPKESAQILNETRKNGGRIICTGTTSIRTLETVTDINGTVKSGLGDTDIFIYPPYEFKAVDGLITNFHLPESTLLMLVSAFAGRKNVLNAYKTAIEEEYRFFSFGDAMLII